MRQIVSRRSEVRGKGFGEESGPCWGVLLRFIHIRQKDTKNSAKDILKQTKTKRCCKTNVIVIR